VRDGTSSDGRERPWRASARVTWAHSHKPCP